MCPLSPPLCPAVLEPSSKKKIVTGTLEDPPSTFDTIQPIGIKFATYNELPLYFYLSVVTWVPIGFHGNSSYINDVTSGRYLGFVSFQILFKLEL